MCISLWKRRNCDQLSSSQFEASSTMHREKCGMKTEWRFIARRFSNDLVLVWPREIATRQTAIAARAGAVEGACAGAHPCGPGPGERAEGREGRRECRKRRRDPH